MSTRYPNPNRPLRYVVKPGEPRAGFIRRSLRWIFRPWLIVLSAFVCALAVGVAGYYYLQFSERIDALLRGEIFTRTAGIYAAPKTLRVGDATSLDEMVVRLKRAGYVEQAQQADGGRGRYHITNTTLEITPSEAAKVDNVAMFASLNIGFDKTGKRVASIVDSEKRQNLKAAFIEAEQIGSVTGTEREKRRVVGFRDLPQHLVKAITTTEDRTFFEHRGVNIRGIARAFLRRYRNEDLDPRLRGQGGSSITQQLVKNLLLTPEKTWRRKIAEAYMSVILETRLSKEQIFALYTNEVYLGQQAGFSINGLGEAARVYFNKDVSDLSLGESAFLAGIIRSPNRYNPYRNIETATARRNQVLDSMQETGAADALKVNQAKSQPLALAKREKRLDTAEAPYFMDYVQGELGEILADTNAAQHLRIYTTIDMDLQRAAYDAVTKNLASLDKVFAKRKIAPGTLQAALVAMNAKTGEVVAMVGGRDYERSTFNRATDAMRQPGSVFKPFVYATAINTAYAPVPRIITAATTYEDKPKEFAAGSQTYAPGNFGDSYSNSLVTVRDALAKSLNVVTVDIANEVTIGRVMNTAAKAGLPRPQRPYLAMALGTNEATPMQIASAYTAFANYGQRATPIGINRITTGGGQTVFAPKTQTNEAMRPDVSFVMTSMMRDVVQRGTAAKLQARGFSKYNIAGKTGTSRDGWFAGYTPEIVCAVYVGFDDGSQLGITGGDSALPIWADFMQVALNQHPEWATDWQPPANVQQAVIDLRTGGLLPADAPPDVPRRTELFISGTMPTTPIAIPNDAVIEQLPEGASDSYQTSPELDMPQTNEPLFDNDSSNGNLPPPPPPTTSPRYDSTYPPSQPTRPRRSTPTLEGRGEMQPDGSTRLQGSITVDIDPTTGLLATGSCPLVRTRTYQLGNQPTKYCSAQYHR